MMVKHIPFLDRPFTDRSAISRWIIQQLPPALSVDGRSLLRTMTAAQLADTPGVTDVCIDLVSAANDSNKNFKGVTEMIGAAIPGGEQSGPGRRMDADGSIVYRWNHTFRITGQSLHSCPSTTTTWVTHLQVSWKRVCSLIVGRRLMHICGAG